MGRLKPLRSTNNSKACRSIRTSTVKENLVTPSDDPMKKKKKKNTPLVTRSPLLQTTDDPCSGEKKWRRRLKTRVAAYFRTKIGGNKKPKEAQQFAKIFSKFLKFAFAEIRAENSEDWSSDWSSLRMGKAIRLIIGRRYDVIEKYLAQFEGLLKAGSILNYWTPILQCLRWFHYDSTMNTKRGKMQITSFEYHMKSVRKALTKDKNKEALGKTVEKLLSEGKLPKDGLPQLEALVSSEYDWALSLTTKQFTDPRIYNKFMSWLYSCYYMVVQGRIGGLEDMKYGQRHALMIPNQHELATNFKTANHHTYQAVSTSDMSAKATEIYVNIARPVIIAINGLSPVEMNADGAPLFLTYTGRAEYQGGKRFTDFFTMKTNGELHMTTTNVRCVYETTANELYEKGDITLEQKNAVTTLGGHNGKTVQKYYLKQKVAKAVLNSFQVMDKVYNRPITDAPVTPVPTNNETPTITPDRTHTTISEHDTVSNGDCSLECYENLFDNMEMDDMEMEDLVDIQGASHLNHEVYWLNDNDGTTTPSSSSSSSSSSSLILEPPPMQSSNLRGCAPLPLPRLNTGQFDKAKRVLWTRKEIDYISKAYDFLIVSLPEEQKRYICKHVYNHILKDPEAMRTIFDSAHITNPQKIRHVIREYIELPRKRDR
jgi:hypothetical protein